MNVLPMAMTVMPILFVSIHVAVFNASVKQDLNVSEVVVEVKFMPLYSTSKHTLTIYRY